MLATLISFLFAIFVYRHASGMSNYNRVLVFTMCLLGFPVSVIALVLGWHSNPRRKQGDDWKTVI